MTQIGGHDLGGRNELSRAALLGVGRMGTALITRFVEQQVYKPGEIIATHHDPSIASALTSQLGIEITTSNQAAVTAAETVYLSVRPQQVRGVVKEIAPIVSKNHTLVSFAVGVPIRWLRRQLPSCGAICHVHPTSLVMAGTKGVSYLAAEHETDPEIVHKVTHVFDSLGPVLVVAEEMMDYYAVYSGIAPALAAELAIQWTDLADQCGIPREHSELVVTLIARALCDGKGCQSERLMQLEKRIATPDGVTEQGLAAIHEVGLDRFLRTITEHSLTRIESLRATFDIQ